jgi:DNA polymerase III delta subunit
MHSDWTLWDFFKANSSSLFAGNTGVYSYSFSDPFSVMFIREELPKEVSSNMITLTGRDLTVEWVEENFETLSLFGTTESYYVLEAQDIKKDVQKKILSMLDFINDRAVLFIFMKENDFSKALKKNGGAKSVKINPPKFWEWDKLFTFLVNRQNMNFDTNAKMMFIEMVNQDIGDYLKYLNMLKLEFDDQQITPDKIKQIVADERFDKFKLIEIFIEKNFMKFFESLTVVRPSYNELKDLFILLQSTLLKVYDPSEVQKKDYKTKFDKKILAVKNIWSPEAVKKTMALLSDLESRAKKKDPFIFQYLITLYNRSFH